MTNEPSREKTGLRGFRPGHTTWAVKLRKMARDLKFLIKKVEELYLVSM